MTMKSWTYGEKPLASVDLNANFSSVLALEGLNHVRSLVQNDQMYSAGYNDLWGEVYYPTLAGRNASVTASVPLGDILTQSYSGMDKTVKEKYDTATSYTNFYGAYWFCQTWTTTSAYTITGVFLKLKRAGTPGTITCSIKEVDGAFKPTGADLCSGTIDGDAISDGDLKWYKFDFGAGTALSNSTKYAIVVRAPAGDAGNSVYTGYNNTSGYSGGTFVLSTNSGSTWALDTTDMVFATYDGSALTDQIITHTIPSGRFSSTISTSYLIPFFNWWESGSDVKYKLTNGGEDSGWLNAGNTGEVSSFTAFTSEPTTVIVKLIPKSSSPTCGYPSIKGFAIRAE